MTDAFRRSAPPVCVPERTGSGSEWYGTQPEWVVPFQVTARRRYGDQLQVLQAPGQLEYRLEALRVRARSDLASATVRFYAAPSYDTFGLAPEDYPRVHADPGAPSPHRMPTDDALCLYFPRDPVEERWHAGLGLLCLLEIVADHLFSEDYWRRTGGARGGVWPGREAPHGLPRAAA